MMRSMFSKEQEKLKGIGCGNKIERWCLSLLTEEKWCSVYAADGEDRFEICREYSGEIIRHDLKKNMVFVP